MQTLLDPLLADKTGDILDYGAGNGGMLPCWKKFGKHIYGYEPDEAARARASTQDYQEVFATEHAALSMRYKVIALCDVLEHIENDAETLRRLYGSLVSGGLLVVTVPAYTWLWSAHDESHRHYRRYTRRQIMARFRDVGFEVVCASYWNTALFIPAALMRILGRSGEGAIGLPKPIDSFLYFIIFLETQVIQLFPLPFGLSIVIIGRRTTSQAQTPRPQ